MSLTGQFFLDVVAGMTLAAFVTVVALWPVAAGRSPARMLARAGMLLLLNGLVLLTAATQLNARYLFFADWTDLRGALSGTVVKTSVARGGSASRAAGRTVPGQAATAGGVLPSLPTGAARSGRTLTYTVNGPLSGITATVVVQLPSGYESAGEAATRYPVLETFQGYPGSPRQWIDTMDLGGEMARQVAAKRMRAALIVSPQVEVPAGVDTECVNGRPGYPQLETWLAQDVPNWVTHTFRVRTDRAAWASIGLSAGGWCAAMVTMLHPAQYGAAIVMGGYFRPELSPAYDPYPPGSALARRYDLPALVRRGPPAVAIWLETSHSDSVSYTSSAALLKVARAPLAVQAVVLRHAGHRISLWQGLLPDSLRWLGTNLSGFSPTP
jgi:enterochelin esterase-like enzyme